MHAFRTSVPARIVSLSIAATLVSGGLLPLLGLHGPTFIPFTLLIGVVGCFFGMLLSVDKHPGAAFALAIALPLSLWPYVMILMLATTTHPQLGWLIVAAGGGITSFSAAGLFHRQPSMGSAPASAMPRAA
jgi:hypothetical protein